MFGSNSCKTRVSALKRGGESVMTDIAGVTNIHEINMSHTHARTHTHTHTHTHTPPPPIATSFSGISPHNYTQRHTQNIFFISALSGRHAQQLPCCACIHKYCCCFSFFWSFAVGTCTSFRSMASKLFVQTLQWPATRKVQTARSDWARSRHVITHQTESEVGLHNPTSLSIPATLATSLKNSPKIINSFTPRDFWVFYTKHPLPNNNRGKYSTTSSLYRGSSSSYIIGSYQPDTKITNSKNRLRWPVTRAEYGMVGINGLTVTWMWWRWQLLMQQRSVSNINSHKPSPARPSDWHAWRSQSAPQRSAAPVIWSPAPEQKAVDLLSSSDFLPLSNRWCVHACVRACVYVHC